MNLQPHLSQKMVPPVPRGLFAFVVECETHTVIVAWSCENAWFVNAEDVGASCPEDGANEDIGANVLRARASIPRSEEDRDSGHAVGKAIIW